MKLRSTLILYAGGPGSGCNPKVGKCGRPSTGKDESEGFVSPNTEENLSFEQAVQNLNSPQQQQAVSRAQFLINKVFGNGTVQSAIGDWKDGAENSVVVNVPGHDKNALDFTLATLGKELNQKSVLSFVHDETGDDRIYTLHTTQDVQSVRKVLEDAGISFRTIVPEQGGETVHVFDQGGKMVDVIGKAAQQLKADGLTVIGGRGEFIGGDTREEGQRQYEQVIRRYQKAAGTVRAAGYQWHERRNRNGLYRWCP